MSLWGAQQIDVISEMLLWSYEVLKQIGMIPDVDISLWSAKTNWYDILHNCYAILRGGGGVLY